jgi:DNA-binding MarR family transcriptional regulator
MNTDLEQDILRILFESQSTCPEQGLAEQELTRKLGVPIGKLRSLVRKLERQHLIESVPLTKAVRGLRLWCITAEGLQKIDKAEQPATIEFRIHDSEVKGPIFIAGRDLGGVSVVQGVPQETETEACLGDSSSTVEADEREHLQSLLEAHRRNLRTLELQKAGYGALDVPLHLHNKIKTEMQEIVEIEAKLAELDT